MATKLYFRNTVNSTTGLPTTEQATSLSSNKDAESQTINRTLSITAGSSEVALTLASNTSTSEQVYYFTRFVSEPLNVSSISANTWTYAFAAEEPGLSANFPCTGTDKAVSVHCYVWRPSTSAKVGTVLEGTTASTVDEGTANEKKSHVATFTGSSVASMLQNDVLIFEVWFKTTQNLPDSFNDIFYYGGTIDPTENTIDQASVASYISTPQNLTFAPTSIDMTNVSTTGYTNKFIIKV